MLRRTVEFCFLLLLAACSADLTPPDTAPDTSAPPAGQFDDAFAEAGAEFGVPAYLLKSIGYAETRWQMVRGEARHGRAPAFGVMALRGENLARGASLAGVSEAAVKSQPKANFRAAAALLSRYAEDEGIDRTDLGAWASVVARYSGVEDEAWRAYYVHNEVYRVLREGAEVERDGERVATLKPRRNIEPQFTLPPAPKLAPQQSNLYPPIVWNPSSNYDSRDDKVIMVIIHTCEGSYAGCVSTLINPDVPASAHYVVDASGSEVSQLVSEGNTAWHIAAAYRCSLNRDKFCGRNGDRTNEFTIGIEHAGYASGTFSAGLIDTSAQLICAISERNGVPLNRVRIVGHGQLQPENRTDPGENWPWKRYLTKAKEKCGDGSGGGDEGVKARTLSGGTYNLRSGPSTSYDIVRQLGGDAPVTILCQEPNGEAITGPYGTTRIWNKLSGGEWITDAYVYTGSNGLVAKRCQ